jgi:uncharacterized protein YecT (DUF1311 family)
MAKRFHLATYLGAAALVGKCIIDAGLASAAQPNCGKPATILEIAQCNKELSCDTAATTFELAQCAALAQNTAELRLEAAYKEALGKLDPMQVEERRMFMEAQAAWRAYREAHCKAVYESYRGGTVRGVAFSGCMQERAESRTFELNDYPHSQ